MRTTSSFRLGLLAVGLLAASAGALAQTFPTDTVHFVIPSGAGTPPDILSRIVMNEVAKTEGWRVVAENKAGAMQTMGGAEALRRPADGHTVMSIALGATVAPALMAQVPFRLDHDFAPVIKIASVTHVLVVHPSVPAQSLAELIALLKREPDKLTFSSGGFGTPAHLAGELFKLSTGVRATHVPYNGALPRAIADLLNGTNQFQFITPLPVLELIAAGKLRAIAVTGPQRLAALPGVPTVVEAGYPQLVIQDWIGYLVKSGTPPAVVTRLNAAVNNALAKPEVRASFTRISADPEGGSAAEFGAFVSQQLVYWQKVVKDAGIRMHQ